MAPQSNSVVEVESINVIDNDDDNVDVAAAAAESPKKERRLEDVRRVRDEADGLRQEICQLRLRLEEVEEESKFHAAKANELTELLMKSNGGSENNSSSNNNNNNGIDETILKQSEDLAKKACQIESLEKKITQLTTEKALLKIERDNAKKETADMSNVVRALQKLNSPDNSFREGDEEEDDDDDDNDNDDDDSEDSEEVVLTPETALDLTLGNLKDHIEMLEDGLQASSSLNSNQKNAISTLEADIKAQQAQIGMLEELFKELNAADRIASLKAAKEEEKLAAEAEKEEASQQKSESSSDTKEPAAAAAKDAKEASTTSTEDTLNKLGSLFRSIGMSAKPKPAKPKPPKKEKRPEIPAEAATAAHAAAIIMGQQNNNPNVSEGQNPNDIVPKQQKKSAMKKVKIRFKKAGLEGTYTGPLVDKKPHGVGTIRFTNGNTYLGEMKRGKMSGSGTLYTKNNGVMRGLFENNRFVGESGDESSSSSSSHSSSSNSSSNSSSSSNNPASADETPKPCDATATTVETEHDDEAKANAVAALELDAFSPSNIARDEIDDSFNMMVNLDGMERKAELAEIRKESEREDNESFLKEFSGSEHSSSLRSDLMLDESNSSHSAVVDAQDIF